ncbi:hypothetical protein ABZW32_24530 [Streptomyces sp. NPDC004667]|uniref:hypothetical protein n=1 Tax=Streptomyces sp. NPDC004667 TaxID=3154285 RepID=UPI0033A5DE23
MGTGKSRNRQQNPDRQAAVDGLVEIREALRERVEGDRLTVEFLLSAEKRISALSKTLIKNSESDANSKYIRDLVDDVLRIAEASRRKLNGPPFVVAGGGRAPADDQEEKARELEQSKARRLAILNSDAEALLDRKVSKLREVIEKSRDILENRRDRGDVSADIERGMIERIRLDEAELHALEQCSSEWIDRRVQDVIRGQEESERQAQNERALRVIVTRMLAHEAFSGLITADTALSLMGDILKSMILSDIVGPADDSRNDVIESHRQNYYLPDAGGSRPVTASSEKALDIDLKVLGVASSAGFRIEDHMVLQAILRISARVFQQINVSDAGGKADPGW